MKRTIYKFIRFGVVGTSGFLVDFSTTWLMLSVFGLFEYGANAVGFTIAATTNYILNRHWTWRSKNPDVRGEFLKFFTVSLAGLFINSLVIYLCQLPGDLDMVISGHTIPGFWVAKLIATGVVMMWNFVINNYFTFRHNNHIGKR